MPVTRVPAREIYSEAVKHLAVSLEVLRGRLAELGREVGKPWRQDQKESLVVAVGDRKGRHRIFWSQVRCSLCLKTSRSMNRRR